MAIKGLISTALVGLAIMSSPASAALITYVGQDNPPTTTSPHPNSTIAAAAFDAAVASIGGGSTVTFESAPTGSFASLATPGLTITGTDYLGANQTIRDTSNFPVAPTLDGYNTTAGGTHFIEVQGGTVTFSFASPVYAFGAYFSGIQTLFFADFITFSDGTTQTLSIPGTGTTNGIGALSFLGFVDVGRAISSVTLNAGSANTGVDFIGVDDVRFAVAPSAVPEPTTWVMMTLGMVMAGFALRRRQMGLIRI